MSLAVSSSNGLEGEKPNPTNVGGQAVIEGVMMRAPGALSIVCRRRDGSLVLRERTVAGPPAGAFRLPFLRGMYTLFSSLKIGNQALRWSAEILEEDLAKEEAEEAAAAKKVAKKVPPGATSIAAMTVANFLTSEIEEIEDEKSKPAKALKEHPEEALEPAEKSTSGIAIALPLIFAIGLFIMLPQAAASGVNRLFDLGLELRSPGFQAITGLSKLVIVVTYLSGLRLIPEVRRVFQYHGAEHKSISTYEAKKDLVVEEARPTSALHARCGTTFIIMVAFVSVIVFSAIGQLLPVLPGGDIVNWFGLFLMKLPFFPVIAGITFELQRFFARYCTTGPLQVLLWPGFLVQKITTAPPDDDQLEVALASLRSALANAAVELPQAHPDRSFPTYESLVDDPSYKLA
jgi:uncharacterized protein YqhQ